MAAGVMRLVISWTESRLEKVVLPDEDGPDISTMRAPPFLKRVAISSAI